MLYVSSDVDTDKASWRDDSYLEEIAKVGT